MIEPPVHSLFDDPADQEAYEEHLERIEEHDRAVEARDRAIEKAERGAYPIWLEEALVAVKAVAYACPMLTSEDVADQLERPAREPRALGSVMRCAADQGWIVPTDAWSPARNPVAHRRPMRVWRSNLYREELAA